MSRLTAALIFALLCLASWTASARPAAPPPAGIGLLIIRSTLSGQNAGSKPLVLYESPGVKRILSMHAADLPSLQPVNEAAPGGIAVAVTDKKGEWQRIAYDDAGREGWIRMEKQWRYTPWRGYLSGRSAALLPGLRAADYGLKTACSDQSASFTEIPAGCVFRIIEVEGDWVKVESEPYPSGWIRWRGNDGRFMITLKAGY